VFKLRLKKKEKVDIGVEDLTAHIGDDLFLGAGDFLQGN
jgi:hypothetical protein